MAGETAKLSLLPSGVDVFLLPFFPLGVIAFFAPGLPRDAEGAATGLALLVVVVLAAPGAGLVGLGRVVAANDEQGNPYNDGQKLLF